MNIIETHDLCKQYGNALRVAHLDLKVPEGSVYGFLGPNGAGKSTTLKMILGLVHPTAGNIQVLGQQMDGKKPPSCAPAGGQPHREPQLLRPPHRGGKPADRPDPPGRAGEKHPGGAADRPAGRPAGQKGSALLPWHEAAAGSGGGSAGLSQAAHSGRAHQRSGPGGHSGDAGADLLPARAVRHDGGGVQPPFKRDRSDGRPCGHHPGGGAGVSGHAGEPSRPQPSPFGPADHQQRGRAGRSAGEVRALSGGRGIPPSSHPLG